MMIKAYTFRIYPTKNQEVKMIRTLDTCRHLYNDSLAEKIHRSKINRLARQLQVFPWGKPEWISYEDQANDLVKNKTELQKEIYSQVLQNVLKRLDRSFQNFFIGFGYPRFQGRNRYDTFTYPGSGFDFTEKISVYDWEKSIIVNSKLSLSKIGNVRIFLHRKLEGKIKTCTIKRDVDQWYAIFTCELDNKKIEFKKNKINQNIGINNLKIQQTSNKVGIDVGLKSLLTLSNGKKIEPPKFFRKSEDKLAWEQRKLSRKKKGSKNRNKQRIKVSKIHRKIRNQRKDFAHKLSRKLVNTFDEIVFEDLQIQNMMQNHNLAKSIVDAGWNQLIRLSNYKAEYAGKIVRLVNPYKSSQICICGYPVPKDLSVRTHKCPECGLVLDRDHVSAMIIKNRPTKEKKTKDKKITKKNVKKIKVDTGQKNIDDCW